MLVTAGCPRKIWYNRVCGKEVEESPGDDHAVVDVEETHHRHRGNSNTWTQQLFFFQLFFLQWIFSLLLVFHPPLSIGHSCATRVIPPEPRYCPMATWMRAVKRHHGLLFLLFCCFVVLLFCPNSVYVLLFCCFEVCLCFVVGNLLEKYRDPTEGHGCEVDDQECTWNKLLSIYMKIKFLLLFYQCRTKPWIC